MGVLGAISKRELERHLETALMGVAAMGRIFRTYGPAGNSTNVGPTILAVQKVGALLLPMMNHEGAALIPAAQLLLASQVARKLRCPQQEALVQVEELRQWLGGPTGGPVPDLVRRLGESLPAHGFFSPEVKLRVRECAPCPQCNAPCVIHCLALFAPPV